MNIYYDYVEEQALITHSVAYDCVVRMLKQISIENAAEVDYIFYMLMGEDVGPRREFIEKNATYANIDA